MNVVAGLSGAAGLSLTLASMFAEPARPAIAFEFTLLAGSFVLVFMLREAATQRLRANGRGLTPTLDGNAAGAKVTFLTATGDLSEVHAYPSENHPE